MGSRKQLQMSEMLSHLAGDYFARENPTDALITVTRGEISPDLKNITIYLSVLPENAEEKTLVFAKRARSDFREYVKKHTLFGHVPTIDFEIDYGEKNRQRVDDLTRQ